MSEIVILASSLPKLVETRTRFVFTDRHAYLMAAKFFTNLKDLDQIDWTLIASRNFQRDINDPAKVERYQAEALVYRHLPISSLLAVICNGPQPLSRVLEIQQAAGISLKTVTEPRWFF